MTYDLAYGWKEFYIHLPSLHEWMKGNLPKYLGASANNRLILHFSEEPSQTMKDRIEMYFNALQEANEAEKKDLDKKREEARKLALFAIPNAMWDSMIPAERKMVMGQQLTKDDLDELVKKHIKQG